MAGPLRNQEYTGRMDLPRLPVEVAAARRLC